MSNFLWTVIFGICPISRVPGTINAGVTAYLVPGGHGFRNQIRQADRVRTQSTGREVTGRCCANWQFSFQLASFVFAYVYGKLHTYQFNKFN